eukprot:CAMPEP_0202425836 /NCGR_PEP_ID=MMETSP1345-20130828/358_1 /ASSEMBLY_ACC=CAM_ASM_000843 /TAXON_ID=342563 /ORGANISM="Fabrea Fabrea salina" /LENGTH=183 /DNA_ID=CAMNT_0049036127 /DNA_START=292 /DNA_END=843 /DNA_ORIENTATION=+
MESCIKEYYTNKAEFEKLENEYYKKETELLKKLKELIKNCQMEDESSYLAQIEAGYKKKTDKLMNVVKEEALVMDKKLSQLQQENSRLREMIASQTNGHSEDSPDSEDSAILQLFQKVESGEDVYEDLCCALAQKLLMEKEHRLKTEQQANQMISEEEKLIKSLEERIKALEGKAPADTIELS